MRTRDQCRGTHRCWHLRAGALAFALRAALLPRMRMRA